MTKEEKKKTTETIPTKSDKPIISSLQITLVENIAIKTLMKHKYPFPSVRISKAQKQKKEKKKNILYLHRVLSLGRLS